MRGCVNNARVIKYAYVREIQVVSSWFQVGFYLKWPNIGWFWLDLAPFAREISHLCVEYFLMN